MIGPNRLKLSGSCLHPDWSSMWPGLCYSPVGVAVFTMGAQLNLDPPDCSSGLI